MSSYGDFRLELLQRIQAEQLTPAAVGRILGEAINDHPEISIAEVKRLLEAGRSWEFAHFGAALNPESEPQRELLLESHAEVLDDSEAETWRRLELAAHDPFSP